MKNEKISEKIKPDFHGPGTPVRIGILCKSGQHPLWLREALERLVSSRRVDVRLIEVRNANAQSLLSRSKSFVGKLWRLRRLWIYLIYLALDRNIHRAKPDAHARGKIDDILSESPTVLSASEITDSRVRLAKNDMATLASSNLDVLLCYDLIPEGFEEHDPATFGVWMIETARDGDAPGSSDIFWRLTEGFPVAEFRIRQTTSMIDRILFRSVLPSCLPEDSRSVNLASNRLLWTAGAWLVRLLDNLYLHRSEMLEAVENGQSMEPVLFSAPPPPENKKMIRLITKRCVQRSKALMTEMSGFDQWNIGYRLDNTVDDSLGLVQFNRMTPPKDRFWADPFPVRFEDHYLIFIEEFIYSSNKGHISVIEMDTDGRWKAPEKILERDYHFSYPNVFLWEENYYMLPESGKNRTIELYKCVSFPFCWELDRILIDDIEVADPTIAEVDGVWWMFVATRPCDVVRDDNFMELRVFQANSPLGPWNMIHDYPVKSDVRSTRPAGNLFWWKGALHRPAQDCSMQYGYAISINRITELTTRAFREKEIARICPESIPDSTCVHTLNRCEGLTVVDMTRRVNRL